MRSVVFAALPALLIGILVGGVIVNRSQGEPLPSLRADAATSSTAVAATSPPHTTASSVPTTLVPAMPTSIPTTSVPTTLTTSPEPVVLVVPELLPDLPSAMASGERLSARVVLPSDCGLPLEVASSLPNADRSYRSGVHQGIDFICGETGRSAVSALAGRVALVVDSYRDPRPEDRNALLAVASEIGSTPPWLLAMLFGNFVVVDHGPIDGVGHVISIYAHLAEVDPSIGPGVEIAAGDRLGEIGNTGTAAAADGRSRPQSLHLHWEIHIDDVYLAAGLATGDTRLVYETLFGGSSR